MILYIYIQTIRVNGKVNLHIDQRNSILIYFLLSYLPTLPLGQDTTQGQFFKQSLTGLNSEFSFS